MSCLGGLRFLTPNGKAGALGISKTCDERGELCHHKGYFGDYKETKIAHTRAINEAKLAKDIFIALDEAPKGSVSAEHQALMDAEAKVITEKT